MAWTTPRTWVAGEVVTAALLNTHLRDNLDALGNPATPWIAPTALNSWVNFGASDSQLGYRKIGDRVELRGLVKSGTGMGFGIFVLPAGYVPPKTLRFAVNSNSAFGMLRVDSAGNVVPDVGSTTSFSLDGVSFSVTA
jgi:hypothetical protein